MEVEFLHTIPEGCRCQLVHLKQVGNICNLNISKRLRELTPFDQEHPDVPVVENLRDMWKVTKLQQERKAKQEKEKALQELEELKAASKPAQVNQRLFAAL